MNPSPQFVLGYLDGGNSNICCFHPANWGRWTHFDEHIFLKWDGSTTNYPKPWKMKVLGPKYMGHNP